MNHQMKHYCTQWDSNPVPSAYEANAQTIELHVHVLNLKYIEQLKVVRVLPECAIKIYLYHAMEKCFFEYYILLTLYSQPTS